MIILRRGDERHHRRRGERETWLTFFPEEAGRPLAGGFGALELFDEERLFPGGRGRHLPARDAEVVTYVREGAVAWRDSRGESGSIQAGEYRRRTTGRGVRHQQSNASPTHLALCFQLALRPAQDDLAPGAEQRRFSFAERHGRLCAVASPDGRGGSLLLHQDVLLYAAFLDPGTHVVHELSPGRGAWLHLLEGAAELGDLRLSAGDGAGLVHERAVSLTALRATEILLVDLALPATTGAPAM
jgi:quercetin 2,3-dioxygenase